jgi:hypothetical protein
MNLNNICITLGQSQWLHGLRRGSAAAHLLGSRVWIPPGLWVSLSCECCVLSGKSLCVRLITCPQDTYWVVCQTEYDYEGGGPGLLGGCHILEKKKYYLGSNRTTLDHQTQESEHGWGFRLCSLKAYEILWLLLYSVCMYVQTTA